MQHRCCFLALLGLALLLSSSPIQAGKSPLENLPVLVKDNFEKGADRWQPKDPEGWKIVAVDGNKVYSQFQKQSSYKPPHRSPYHIALLKDVRVGSFVLDAKVKSTIKDYAHRDACLYFGYQDPKHFYYVHFGKKTDDHANQIFIVSAADRKKISTKTTPGTHWTDDWHHVRIVRDARKGDIRVYFDDMKSPVMSANDLSFTWGQVGIGSFDDTTMWDDVTLRGMEVKK